MSIKTVDIEGIDGGDAPWERTVRRAVQALRYGSVEVVVHDGRVVQVETREKIRFPDSRLPDDRRRSPHERRPDRDPGGAAATTPEDTQ
jgi:hypothetical protein